MRVWLLLPIVLAGCATVPPARAGFERGVALGLFGPEPVVPYALQLDEIHALGASHVALVYTGFVSDVHGSKVFGWPGFTPTPEELEPTVARARAKGLSVTLFPILRLANRTPAEWRGVLVPDDPEAFFTSYEQFLLGYARVAARAGAETLIIGSELNAIEQHVDRWHTLIARVRAVFPGRLVYSANWDRYAAVPFWDKLDAVGISAYYELAPWGRVRPSVDAMVRAWTPIRRELAAFAARVRRPIVFTEIGYPSQVGTSTRPWDETRDAELDQEEQRRCFVAFARAFSDDATLGGSYVWLWFERGGLGDGSYTPRGKSAEFALREYYRPREWLPSPR